RPGVEMLAEAAGLRDALTDATLVITAEGRLDAQTAQGKTPIGVARIAHACGVPCIALAGALGDGYQAVYAEGVASAFSIIAGPTTLEDAIARGYERLANTAESVVRLWMAAERRDG